MKSYEQELREIRIMLVEMANLTEIQCDEAVAAIVSHDPDLGSKVVENDWKINQLEQNLENLGMRVLALRQPMAADLRTILGALRIAMELERIADYAKNIAKRVRKLDAKPPKEALDQIVQMGALIKSIIGQAREALHRSDPDLAMQIHRSDDQVDEIYLKLMDSLRSQMTGQRDEGNVNLFTHLMFIAKNLERMGDRLTNVAEQIYFMATGSPLKA